MFSIDNALADFSAVEERVAPPTFDGCLRTTDLIIGARNLRAFIPAIRELLLRCGQQNDITTGPQYFIAANTMNRRAAKVKWAKAFLLAAAERRPTIPKG